MYGPHLFKSKTKRGGGKGAVPNYAQMGKGLSHYVPNLWGVKSRNDVSKAQLLRRKERRSGLEPTAVRLLKAPTARPNRLIANADI